MMPKISKVDALTDFNALFIAIAEAREVDEAVGIRDEAIRLETNARRARNKEARRKARELQLEAARKAGQLLTAMQKAGLRETGRATKGFRAGAPTGLPTLDDLGPYRTESQTWQKLGTIPQDKWDAALADKTVMPTTAGMIRLIAEPKSTSVGAKIHSISLSSIESPPSRVRALRQKVVDALAESMHDRGLINPITVGPREGLRYQLIAGHHRYVAARKLEWEKIPAIVLKGLDAVDAELCEIDENLIRADLTQAEQAAHHARRKELYEQKHPETKPTNRAGPGRGKTRRQNGNESGDRYTKNTAEETGDSERTIQRAVKRGNDIPNVAELAGTSLDQGAELDALAKLKDIAPDRQAELIEQAKEGEKVSAKAEINARGRNQSRKPKPAASGTEQTPPAVNDARDDVAQPDKPAPEPPQRDLAAVVGELPAPESADPASLLDTIRATIRGLTNIDFDQVATIPANHLLEVRSELDEAAGELRAVITQAIESATVREKEPPPASRGVREGDYGLA